MISFSAHKNIEGSFLPGTQYGSNQGGIHIMPTGERSYIKYPKSPEQANVEAAMAELYSHVGIKTLNPEVVDHGKIGVKSAWRSDLKRLRPDQFHDHISTPKQAKELGLIHHAAVISKNHDVVGQDHDNILLDKNGSLVSIDQGGAMHFRAQGAPKEFGPDVEEIKVFDNKNRTAGSLFHPVFQKFPEATKEAALDIKSRMTDDAIDSILSKHGLSSHADTLKKRRDALLAHYSVD